MNGSGHIGLCGENEKHWGLGIDFKIGKEPDFFKVFGGEQLRLIDDEQGELAKRDT
jgi:hypothetical protein